MKNDSVVLLGLLREQEAMYAELLGLACRQKSLVAQEETGPLLAVLAERQRLSSSLRRVAGELEPVRRDWNQVRSQLSDGQRDEADELLGRAGEHLRRVIESDEEDARLLAIRKASLPGQLHRAHAGISAMNAYRERTVPSRSSGKGGYVQ